MEEHTRLRGVPFTFVHVAFYFENFINYFPPQKQPDGNYGFGFPLAEAPLAALAVDDTGGVVTAIFENRAEFLGTTVEIVGDQMSAQQFAQIMSRVLRRKVTYNHIPRDTYAALGFPGARDLADMFEFLRVHLPNRRAGGCIRRCRPLRRGYKPMWKDSLRFWQRRAGEAARARRAAPPIISRAAPVRRILDGAAKSKLLRQPGSSSAAV